MASTYEETWQFKVADNNAMQKTNILSLWKCIRGAEYGSHVGVKMDLAGVAVQYGEKSYF